jgi:hypothetical protein
MGEGWELTEEERGRHGRCGGSVADALVLGKPLDIGVVSETSSVSAQTKL